MNNTFISAKDPRWADTEHNAIDLIAKFSNISEEVPYTARPNDVEQMGRDIYNRALAGDFGSVAEYIPPPPPSFEFIESQVRYVRNEKLRIEVDPIVSNPLRWEGMTEEQQNAWKNYRLELLAITTNPSFPWYEQVVEHGIDAVPWPTRPAWPN